MKAIIKVVGTHALINAGFAGLATILMDLYKLRHIILEENTK